MNLQNLYKIIFPFLFILLFFFSCAHEKSIRNKSLAVLKHTSVSIEMPKNILVFENISPIIYDAFCYHFINVGYNLNEQINPGFILKTEIKKLDEFGKLISPDVLSYGFNIRLELLCSLFDGNNKLLKEKTFKVSTAVFKPANPILSSNFYTKGYEKLARRAVVKVEQYFRPYFLKSKNDEI